MRNFIINRLLNAIPTLLLMSLIIFFVVTLPPGDPLTNYEQKLITEDQFTPQDAKEFTDQIRSWYGIGKPWLIEYATWLSRFIKGDFGYSFSQQKKVSEIIGQRIFFSFLISGLTLIFTWVVGVPIGIISAVKRYSVTDYTFTFIGFIGLAIPNFFLAILILSLMWFGFKIPPPSGILSQIYIDAPWSFAKIWDLLKHLWLPIVVIGTSGIATIIRIMRGSLLDVLNRQYVQTARAKGIPERKVILKHSVKIAINPLISLLGMQIPLILSGEVLGSIVLNLPTMGPLLYTSLIYEDFYVSGALLMFMAVFLVVGNLIADILLTLVDPRINLESNNA